MHKHHIIIIVNDVPENINNLCSNTDRLDLSGESQYKGKVMRALLSSYSSHVSQNGEPVHIVGSAVACLFQLISVENAPILVTGSRRKFKNRQED